MAKRPNASCARIIPRGALWANDPEAGPAPPTRTHIKIFNISFESSVTHSSRRPAAMPGAGRGDRGRNHSCRPPRALRSSITARLDVVSRVNASTGGDAFLRGRRRRRPGAVTFPERRQPAPRRRLARRGVLLRGLSTRRRRAAPRVLTSTLGRVQHPSYEYARLVAQTTAKGHGHVPTEKKERSKNTS